MILSGIICYASAVLSDLNLLVCLAVGFANDFNQRPSVFLVDGVDLTLLMGLPKWFSALRLCYLQFPVSGVWRRVWVPKGDSWVGGLTHQEGGLCVYGVVWHQGLFQHCLHGIGGSGPLRLVGLL